MSTGGEGDSAAQAAAAAKPTPAEGAAAGGEKAKAPRPKYGRQARAGGSAGSGGSGSGGNASAGGVGVTPAPTADGLHPLESEWSIWYDKKPKVRSADFDYLAHMNEIARVQTVEEFWGVLRQLKRPSLLKKDTNYHIFRSGLPPMWESFPKGGAFIKKVRKSDDGALLDRMWEELAFAVVGEVFEDPDVVGVVCSIRQREGILSIWTKENSTPQMRFKIGNKLKAVWMLDPNTIIEFKTHAQSMRDGSSYRRTRRANPRLAPKAEETTPASEPLLQVPAGGALPLSKPTM
jgi:translation initiation factor 4E